MKRSILLLLASIFLFTACNFPLAQPTVDQSAVATKVAQVLTQTSLPPTSGSQPTNVNSLTPVPAGTTVTPLETATVTVTSTPTLTPTPSDPSQMYGSPYWQNGMDSGASFGLSTPYNDGNSAFSISGGKLIMTSLTLSGWKGWRLTDRKIANYYMEDIFITQNCSGMDSYGIVFRAPDYSSGYGYYFGITCDGQYSLMRWSPSGESYLQSWKNSPEILSGSNQTNKIGVLVKGNDIKLYVNSKQIQEINDPTFPAQTIIGVFIAGFSTSNFTVDVDQITMWQVP